MPQPYIANFLFFFMNKYFLIHLELKWLNKCRIKLLNICSIKGRIHLSRLTRVDAEKLLEKKMVFEALLGQAKMFSETPYAINTPCDIVLK